MEQKRPRRVLASDQDVTGTTLRIGALRAGGVILGYRCSSSCRHCLYACGPHRSAGSKSSRVLDDLLDRLQHRGPAARYHLGGGEPFLDRARLTYAMRAFHHRHLKLEYVETNALWVRDRAHAETVLAPLAEVGLECVLVSLSPFHAEFVPLRRTLALIEAAHAVLPGGAFVWMPCFLEDLADADPQSPIDLDAFLAQRGNDYARQLGLRYALVPGGKAGRFLFNHGQRVPFEQLLHPSPPCRARLEDTSHFHVDLEGRYIPGLCAGLGLPLAELTSNVHLDRYPVLRALARHDVEGLLELARGSGFVPDETYASSCDLCVHARQTLYRTGKYAELGPAGFYDPMSIPGYGS